MALNNNIDKRIIVAMSGVMVLTIALLSLADQLLWGGSLAFINRGLLGTVPMAITTAISFIFTGIGLLTIAVAGNLWVRRAG